MDEHFGELFARYRTLVPQQVVSPAARLEITIGDVAPAAALGS
jgi:hypothetical protein